MLGQSGIIVVSVLFSGLLKGQNQDKEIKIPGQHSCLFSSFRSVMCVSYVTFSNKYVLLNDGRSMRVIS